MVMIMVVIYHSYGPLAQRFIDQSRWITVDHQFDPGIFRPVIIILQGYGDLAWPLFQDCMKIL